MFVAGDENGRLRRDVMRCRRRRRFFLPTIWLPSTSQSGRRLLSDSICLRAAAKENLTADGAEKVNLKVKPLGSPVLPKMRGIPMSGGGPCFIYGFVVSLR